MKKNSLMTKLVSVFIKNEIGDYLNVRYDKTGRIRKGQVKTNVPLQKSLNFLKILKF